MSGIGFLFCCACRYEPVRIHDLKRLEKVKADMKLEDVKVHRPSPMLKDLSTDNSVSNQPVPCMHMIAFTLWTQTCS